MYSVAVILRPEGLWSFGHLEAGFHFVPEGRAIVARRFIAGLAINMICVPEGRLKVDLSRRGRRIGVWGYGRMGMPV
jgi:hypothetical protein